MTVLKEQDGSWTLEDDASGRYLLSVLCGMVGLFEIQIALSAEELEDWKKEGDSFLERLALKVSRNPEAFQSRHVETVG